jgi:hypothetical protein
MTDTEIQTTILEEIRALRVSFENYSANMELRVSTLETHMGRLVAPVPASRLRPRPVLVKASKRRQS